MIVANARGDQLIEILRIEERELPAYQPLTHALVVARSARGTLLVLNVHKSCWEIAGGLIDPGETPRQCAQRELEEESAQVCEDLRFIGVMRFLLQPTQRQPTVRTELGALYFAQIDEPREFRANDETARITWWDGKTDIGVIDAIDAALALL